MKITNIILTIIITVLFFGCAKEENPEIIDNLFFQPYDVSKDYTLYNTIKTENRDNYLYEDFDIDTGIFPELTSTNFTGYISSGEYLLTNNTPDKRLVYYDINDISNLDFEISYFIKRLDWGSGNNKDAIFFWGSNTSHTSFNFYLENDSHDGADILPGIQVGRMVDSEFDFWEWEALDNTYSSNRFTIRKIDNKYYFFINDNFVEQKNFNVFSGNRIGFIVGEYSSFSVNNFKIDYLVGLE